jgi:mannosylglucosylglycerate synthase
MQIKKRGFVKFKKKDIPKLRYGIIHSQFGFTDGVSIVMKQIETIMTKEMDIPRDHIYYLVGQAKSSYINLTRNKILWHKNKVNKLMLKYFNKGYGGGISEQIELEINKTKTIIKDFIEKNKIDVVIAHNSSHPVNFISSVALSRYYRDNVNENKKTPKYLVWWHDSHLERERFKNPAVDVDRYLRQGVPGLYVEYIIFINTTQYDLAKNYFMEIGKDKLGYYEEILENHDVVYNFADILINSFKDLKKLKYAVLITNFLDGFGIKNTLQENNISLNDVQFVLQHTRIVPRKRIDFALKYSYELFDELKKKSKKRAMVFFVSGHSGDEKKYYKRKLINLNKKLSEKYNTNKFFLIFAEDYPNINLNFEEYPIVFARLGGISTYFSEIEGFGNNLLEVLSGGLMPIVYTYPVFRKDIAKYNFNIVCLDKFEIDDESINKTIDLIIKDRKRSQLSDKNIEILKKKFPHKIFAAKLKRAIIRRRTHV